MQPFRKTVTHLFLTWTLLSQSLVLPAVAAPAATAPPAAAAAATSPLPLPAGVRYVTTVEGISEYNLPNGMRVLLFPDDSVQNVTVNVTYLVGSRLESYGETGMAHLLEHMLFKGSKNHTNIPQELSEHGAHSNATTWLDRTNYFETVEATDANLDWALRMEADRMVNSFIAKKDLDTEMTVVRNEYESGENNPAEIMIERGLETAYLWHNYGHPTIGARSDIEGVPIEHLQAFYHTYYQPDNAVLVVAGRFNPATTLAKVADVFGAIPRPTRVMPRTYTEEPTQDGEREVTLRRTGDVQDVGVLYHIPSGAHADFPALDIFIQLMADTPSGRLYKQLVDTKKATSIGGSTYQLHDPGVAFFTAEVNKSTSVDPAKETLVTAVETDAIRHPITAEEVNRARAALLKSIELSLNNTERVGLDLSEWQAMGDWRLLFLYRDALKNVTPADVQRVATTYFKPSNRTLAVFLPTAKPDRVAIPPSPDIQKLVSGYHGQAAVATGEKFDASAANIQQRTQWTAATGAPAIKLALLSKKTRGSMVYLKLGFHFGDLQSLRGKAIVGDLAGSMLMRGTLHHTRQQLKDEFDRLKAVVRVDGTGTGATVSVQTESANLPAVLKLVNEILREPSFPPAEFEQMRQEYITTLEQGKSDPQARGNNTLSRHMSPYPKEDPRYVATPDEEIAELKTITLDQVRVFYKDFYGTSIGDGAVVGDFDDKTLSKMIADLFGNWKSPRAYNRIPSEYHDVKPLDETIETPDKENAYYVSGLEVPMTSNDADFPAMILGNYMMGGGFLNSRLATRVRQKEGLSYGVGSYFSANALDKVGSFGVYAIFAPQNGPKVKTAIREVLETALKDGFTDKEVEAAKVGLLQSRQVDRAKDGSLVGRLETYRFVGRTFQWDIDFENRIRALTPQQVLEALRRHIDVSRINVVMAGDFAKAKGAGGH